MHMYICWYIEYNVLLIVGFFDVAHVAILTPSLLLFSCSL